MMLSKDDFFQVLTGGLSPKKGDFAVSYINWMASHHDDIVDHLRTLQKHDRNLTLIQDARALDLVTRRLGVVADLFVIGETSCTGYLYEGSFDLPSGFREASDDYAMDQDPVFLDSEREVLTSDWLFLQDWMHRARRFLRMGRVVYLPRVQETSRVIARSTSEESTNLDPIFDKANYVLHAEPRVLGESSYLAPMFQLKIPYLDAADLETLAHLFEDEEEVFARFRDHLVLACLEADAAWGSESYEKEIVRIQKSMVDEGLREISSDLRSARRKKAIQIAGAVTGFVTLRVYVILGMEPLLALLGPAGIAPYAAKQVADYLAEVRRVQQRPMFFLWKLGQAERL